MRLFVRATIGIIASAATGAVLWAAVAMADSSVGSLSADSNAATTTIDDGGSFDVTHQTAFYFDGDQTFVGTGYTAILFLPEGDVSEQLCGAADRTGCNWIADNDQNWTSASEQVTDPKQLVNWHINLPTLLGGAYYGTYHVGLIKGDHLSTCTNYAACTPYLVETAKYDWGLASTTIADAQATPSIDLTSYDSLTSLTALSTSTAATSTIADATSTIPTNLTLSATSTASATSTVVNSAIGSSTISLSAYDSGSMTSFSTTSATSSASITAKTDASIGTTSPSAETSSASAVVATPATSTPATVTQTASASDATNAAATTPPTSTDSGSAQITTPPDSATPTTTTPPTAPATTDTPPPAAPAPTTDQTASAPDAVSP